MKKILVIDDSKIIQGVYSNKLENSGFEVVVAKDGEEGVEKIKESRPDLILLDIIMPDSNGFEVLSFLQSDEDLKEIPVIVFSDLSQKSDVDKAFELGAKKCMSKSECSVSEIVSEVEKILEV